MNVDVTKSLSPLYQTVLETEEKVASKLSRGEVKFFAKARKIILRSILLFDKWKQCDKG